MRDFVGLGVPANAFADPIAELPFRCLVCAGHRRFDLRHARGNNGASLGISFVLGQPVQGDDHGVMESPVAGGQRSESGHVDHVVRVGSPDLAGLQQCVGIDRILGVELDDLEFCEQQLGEWGYAFQFITLAGFHSLNAGMFELAQGYRERGMSAYVELQEREFAMEADGYTATKHQREVGAGYFDQVMKAVSKDSSTLALEGSTEEAQADIGRFVANKLAIFVSDGNTTLSVNMPAIALPQQEATHRIAHVHRNTPGVLAQVNSILAAHAVNIEGQLLATRGEVGYLLTDISRQYPDAVLTELAALPATIGLRVLS